MAEVKVDTRKIWLVKHPVSLYEEDVKAVARRENLRIVDSRFRSNVGMEFLANPQPKLTPKPIEQKRKRGRPAIQDKEG